MNKKPILIKKKQNIYKVYFQSSEKMDQVIQRRGVRVHP